MLFLCGGFVFAQTGTGNQSGRPWWYTMEQGKLYFRNGDYGRALLAFEDARRDRKAMYTRMEQNFISFLSISEVRRLGDSLERVEAYLSDHNYAEVSAALGELYYRVKREDLNNSSAQALAALGRLKDYPEAEYWIGETYRVEGESGVALAQFLKVHEQRSLLENPGFDTELLYKIANIHRLRQEYVEMERVLIEILSGSNPDHPGDNPEEVLVRDTLWAGDADSFAKTAMKGTLENDKDGINRFLTLYRYNNTAVEEAHRQLGVYYYATGRHSRAEEHLMFAFLIQNTVLLEEAARRKYDYTFTSLAALMEEARGDPLLASYAEKTDYYKTAYYLGTSLYGVGKLTSARIFWQFLSGQPSAGEWQARSQTQLRSPFVERAVEQP